jgi:hypothetical protein
MVDVIYKEEECCARTPAIAGELMLNVADSRPNTALEGSGVE